MLLFDVLLLSVIIVTGYFCLTVLWRLRSGQRTFGAMVAIDLALAIAALGSRRIEGPNSVGDLIGVIAIGGGICLIMVPPLLRDMAQRALLHNRPRLARLFVDVRALLQPGMGGEHDRELIDTLIAVRSGREDVAIDRLLEQREAAEDSLSRRRIDERIVMTYLYARRWPKAVEYYEQHFDTTSPIPLQLEVEMVRGFCEVGDLSAAARLIERIERIGDTPMAADPGLSALVNRARLVFLAFVGRTGAVESIVATGGALEAMPANARAFWSGLARLRAGDRAGARTSLTRATELSRGDDRVHGVARAALDSIDVDGIAGPHPIPQHAAEIADKISASAAQPAPRRKPRKAPLQLTGVALRRVPVTVGMIAVNLFVAVVTYVLFDSGGDIGGLVRAGASVPAAVEVGEWWRISSYMFLHVGFVHLGINMYGLWALGRLVEQMHGSRAYFAVYVFSGLVGGVASVLFGGAAAAGASGAVMGVLGAAIAEFTVHRKFYPQKWTRSLTGLLLFLVAANVVIGFVYPVIDQSAHLGGLVAGALLALVLSPHSRFKSWRSKLSTGLVAIGAVALVYGAIGVFSSNFADTLSRFGDAEYELGGVQVVLPATFVDVDGAFVQDESQLLRFAMSRAVADMTLEDAVSAYMSGTRARVAEDDGFDHSEIASNKVVDVPKPWLSRELVLRADALGVVQHYRVVVFGRTHGTEFWLGSFYVPEHLATGAAPSLVTALTSATLVAKPPALETPAGD